MEEIEIVETEFDRVFNKIRKVSEGNSEPSLPIGFPRLGKHVCIRKGMYFLLVGYTGSAKSTIVEQMFILNLYDWYLKHKNYTKTKIKIFYYSMERGREYKINKWVNRKIYLDTGINIPVGSNLGWEGYPPLQSHQLKLIESYKGYIDEMFSSGFLEIYDGPKNPMDVKRRFEDYAKTVGTVKKVSEFNSIYIPNDPNQINIIIKDHISLMKKETRDGIIYSTKKDIIDLASADDRKFRDRYGVCVVNVSQLNRSIANPMRIKNGDVKVQLEDIKESGNTSEDADVVMGIFDPMRYKVPDPAGYDLTKLRDSSGSKYYRYLEILKNSYGSDGIGMGLGMWPEQGIFKEMPKQDIITPQDYHDITSGKFFRK